MSIAMQRRADGPPERSRKQGNFVGKTFKSQSPLSGGV
jgi:hypothetical protein